MTTMSKYLKMNLFNDRKPKVAKREEKLVGFNFDFNHKLRIDRLSMVNIQNGGF